MVVADGKIIESYAYPASVVSAEIDSDVSTAVPLTTRGDILIKDASNVNNRLAVGTATQVLTSDGTDITWENNAAGFADPLTTRGDIIIKDAANDTVRLGIGANGEVLKSDGTDISWGAGGGGSSLAHFFLPVESAYLPVTNPAALTEHAGATVYSGWSTADFDDTTKESIVWRIPMPDYDDGNIVIKAFGRPKTTAGAAKTAQFDILTIGLATSEPFDAAVTVDTTVNISFALDTTELQTDIMVATATIDPANVTADDVMVMELERDVGTDDLSGDFELLYILGEYTKA